MESLDTKIKRLIDNSIVCKRDEITDELERKIHLSALEKIVSDSDEFDYAMKYLNDNNISVVGNRKSLGYEYENYRYHSSREYSNMRVEFLKLSNDEQLELLRKYQDNKDKDAITKLVSAYENFLSLEVSKYSRKYDVEQEDLRQDAYIVLMNAFNKFDFRDNTLFVFVDRYVRTGILTSIRDYYGINHYADCNKFLNARNKVKMNYYYGEDYNEYEHIDEIISTFMDNEEKRKYQDLRMINMIYGLSLDEVEDDIIASDDGLLYTEVLEKVFQEEVKEIISNELEELLTPNQYFNITNYYGFGEKEKNLKEIAKIKNCSIQSVNSSIKGANDKLRKNIDKELLDSYSYNYEYRKVKQKRKEEGNR